MILWDSIIDFYGLSVERLGSTTLSIHRSLGGKEHALLRFSPLVTAVFDSGLPNGITGEFWGGGSGLDDVDASSVDHSLLLLVERKELGHDGTNNNPARIIISDTTSWGHGRPEEDRHPARVRSALLLAISLLLLFGGAGRFIHSFSTQNRVDDDDRSGRCRRSRRACFSI
jgi:hypothetical protein